MEPLTRESFSPEELKEIEKSLLSRIVKIDDHWLYPAGLKGGHRYGSLRINGEVERAHRVSAMLWLNYDLNDKEHIICHIRSCPHKNCINPKHLYIGTDSDNMMDAARTRAKRSNQPRKTQCPSDHEFVLRRGRRHCETCRRIWKENHREEQKEYLKNWRAKRKEQNVQK